MLFKKEGGKLNIFSNSHYLDLEEKLILRSMNNFGIILGEPNSINSEILVNLLQIKK